MIVCAGRNEYFSFAKSIGVGLVESAMGLTHICMRESVDALIFIGSAGAYQKDIPLFSLWLSDSATQLELSLLQGQSYTPLDNHIQSNVLNDIDISHVSHRTQLPTYQNPQKAIVNSSNYITTDKSLATRFCAVDIVLENMEFFSVMRVAQEFGLPCFGVFCVSNYCDENAHRDFIANHSKVKEILSLQYNFIESLQAKLKLPKSQSTDFHKR